MKIAINGAFLLPKGGGIKEYIVNLVQNLSSQFPEDEYILYVLKDYREYASTYIHSPNVRIKEIPFSTGSLKKKFIRSVFEGRYWRKEETYEKWDIFHSPFFHAPKLKSTPLLITVHDMRFYRYPKTYDFFRYLFLKRAVKESLLRADKIITISEFTKSEVIEAYGMQQEKIRVVLEAIDSKKFSNKSSEGAEIPEELINSRFILSVGHLEPRKNYDRLISAYVMMKQKYPDLQNIRLVIVGKKGCYYDSTLKLIEASEGVVYLDFVPDNLLVWLYQNATLFTFPSIYEGFGFPPLEAASLGVISAVSNVSSIPEVCGDAVLYFNPFDTEDISEALAKGVSDSSIRENLSNKLTSQLEKFSWAKNAIETHEEYSSLLSH